MVEMFGKTRLEPTFRQKIIISVVAVAVVCTGLWLMQNRWIWEDPENVRVDDEVEEKINSLLEESKAFDFQRRLSIFYEIQGMGRDRIPVLVRALRNEDPRIRAFSANLLQYCDNSSVIPHLEARLADADSIVRRSALSALGALGTFESAPMIILVLQDKDNFTRCQAALVLGGLGGNEAVAPLIEILKRDPYPIARRTAANSLGEIGNEKAVPVLIESLRDENKYVRSASLVALNRVTGAGLGSNKEDWAAWWARKQASPAP